MRKYIIVVVALALALVACDSSNGVNSTVGDTTAGSSAPDSSTSSTAPDASADQPLIRLGTTFVPSSINPFNTTATTPLTMFRQMYPFLLDMDGELALTPDFATSWEASEDQKTWTFTTHDNAKWSDGEPLTAADAAWTLTTIAEFKDSATALFAGLITNMVSAEAPNPTTLVVSYSAPVANVLAQLHQIPILPQHVWEEYAVGDGTELKGFANDTDVVTGGSFNLVKYEANASAIFERNPDFYGPAPKVPGFGMQFFESPDSMIAALQADSLDWIQYPPPTAVATLEQDDNLVVGKAVGLVQLGFFINSHPDKSHNRELLDPDVRLAIAHALDSSEIIDVVHLGLGEPAGSIIPAANTIFSNPEIQPVPFDPALANEILDGLGFEKGSDGIRVADGEAMNYNIVYVPDATNTRTVELMAQNLREIGIELTPQPTDGSGFLAELNKNESRDFDIALDGQFGAPDPDRLLSSMTCAVNQTNTETAYCNPEYDRLYEQQATIGDVEERKAIINEMQAILDHDKPVIWYVNMTIVEAWNRSWDGFPMGPQGSINWQSKLALESVYQP